MSQSAPTAHDTFTVINTAGIHLRPAQMMAEISSRYESCEVTAIKDDVRVNAKSIMGITELIGTCGSRIEFEIVGADAEDCLEKLRELFQSGFGEEIDPAYESAGNT